MEKLKEIIAVAKQNKLRIVTATVIVLLVASQVYLYLSLVSLARYSTPAVFQVSNGKSTSTISTLQAVVRSLEVTEALRNNAQANANSQEAGNANPSDTQPRLAPDITN